MLSGKLFTHDYLLEGIKDSDAWKALDEDRLKAFREKVGSRIAAITKLKNPNEPETEKEIIWPVLEALGWTETLPQQNLSFKGRERVPDGLLFTDADSKTKASSEKGAARFRYGHCIMEAKRWNRALDKKDSSDDDTGIPSSQMLGYLRRVDDVTQGKLRWGILTNGRQWRLYFQGADSVSEDYLEIDLGGVFTLPGYRDDLFAAKVDSDHALKLFLLLFGKAAFTAQHQGRTLHALVRDQGKQWEARVAADLSALVFDEVFPKLLQALAAHDPQKDKKLGAAYLAELRDGALIFLYRLLFVLYAEDRNLLPDEQGPYKEYALTRIRNDIEQKKSAKETFSGKSTLYWSRLRTVFRSISEGDDSLGIPPYNGGLFREDAAPLLQRAELPDDVLSDLIFSLSHEQAEPHPKYINYRDLSVQQLGSIYERLLEYDVAAEDKKIEIRLNSFARKGSGSYYTPESLVKLIIERTVGPLVEERIAAFEAKSEALAKDKRPLAARLQELAEHDAASRILDLKICDPAMGSGHFLVSLVDWMADRVLAAMEQGAETASWAGKQKYESPLAARIAEIRGRIEARAKKHKWPLPEKQLDDRNIVRRMILKRCIFGVDLNPMAVELAKVALWLHTFTVGAPLSFLDHHLRCGNSLFGERVRGALHWLSERGSLLISNELKKAQGARAGMEEIEALTDADIAEAKESAESFAEVESGTQPVENLMDFIHVLRWHDPRDAASHKKVAEFLDGQFGDPLEVLNGKPAKDEVFAKLLAGWKQKIAEQRFLHWEIAFPGVWTNWESAEPSGGFDAVIGNPPWDRIKFQEVEWFAARKPEIARAQRASDRKKMVAALRKKKDPLAEQHERAVEAAEAQARVARTIGNYPLLSGGDTNIYSLFVEQGGNLIKPDGLVGLLTPSGIASDMTASKFFKSVATTGRLAALFDFENRRPEQEPFFPDVDSRFKFCAFVTGGKKRTFDGAQCAFFLNDVQQIEDPDRSFTLTAEDFSRVNPNTGTAPIFRTRRDAEITREIYQRLPVLVDRSKGQETAAFPVKYVRMFDMTNDSNLFVTREELEKSAYKVEGNRWMRGGEEFLPLYVGRMIHQFDHRAASVSVNEENVHVAASSDDSSEQQKQDPAYSPSPQYWVSATHVEWPNAQQWSLAFRDIARANDERTIIAALVPKVAANNKLPLLSASLSDSTLLVANFNSIAHDFVARRKVHSTSVNWFIAEQFPVIPRDAYARKFGKKSAADIVKEDVLALTYTAHDMAPFARDMGYTGKPFKWDEADRARRRARLDALYFMLYFPSKTKEEIAALRDTAEYIFSTFPIVEREDMASHGRYLSCDLCLAYINALAAGDPDAKISL